MAFSSAFIAPIGIYIRNRSPETLNEAHRHETSRALILDLFRNYCKTMFLVGFTVDGAYPIFYFMLERQTSSVMLSMMVILVFLHGINSGAMFCLITEAFPTQVRGIGVSHTLCFSSFNFWWYSSIHSDMADSC